MNHWYIPVCVWNYSIYNVHSCTQYIASVNRYFKIQKIHQSDNANHFLSLVLVVCVCGGGGCIQKYILRSPFPLTPMMAASLYESL